jgi:hypothetical protein
MRPGEPRVSVRLRKIKEFFAHGTKGVVKHDFRGYTDEDRPHYIDPEESYRNKELLGRVRGDWEEIYQQLCEIELQQRQRFEELKKQGIIPKNQGWKKTTPAFVSGIITFSKEAQIKIADIPKEFEGQKVIYLSAEVDENGEIVDKVVEEVSIETIDELAVKFVREFEKRYGARAVYLVRHLDETAPHYHFLFENLRDNGKMLSNTFVKPSVIQKGKARPYQINVQEIQDLAGEIFSSIGFMRGETKEQRLARGEKEYLKPLRKFKDVAQREEEVLYHRLKNLRVGVVELESQVSVLTKKKRELEERIKEYEMAKRAYEEDLARIWRELVEKERLLAEYEGRLRYYKENWEQLVDEAVREGIEEEMEEERQKVRSLERKFKKLKRFIEREYGSYMVDDILNDNLGRGRGGPGI